MISVLLSALVEMNPNWGIDREPQLVEPARRHRCENCENVFECHLCTITFTHLIHADRPKMSPDEPMFICEECCKIFAIRFQLRECDGNHIHYYYTDMLTGEAKLSKKRVIELCQLKSNQEPPTIYER